MKKTDLQATLSKKRREDLNNFCERTGIRFKNISLLDQAFHHRSMTNEMKHLKNNERLEFLGDSVLGMVTASYLYKLLDNPEGDLAKIKSYVVSEKALAPVALQFGVDKLLLLGHGEEMTGGRTKPAILADCVEAIIGAYFLDSGFKNAEKFVLTFIMTAVDEVLKNGMKDYKTLLQEIYQKQFKICPEYEIIDRQGPDHNQIFKCVVHLGDKTIGPESGKSKKEAEQMVAKTALDLMNAENK